MGMGERVGFPLLPGAPPLGAMHKADALYLFLWAILFVLLCSGSD